MKKYNYARSVNPTGIYQSIKVYPTQGISLILNDVSSIVTLMTDYFIEEGRVIDERLIIKIGQKYDLTTWSKYGCASLGEIQIKRGAEVSYLCIILIGEIDSTLCVINPVAQFVKFEPHQTIEVVCFERSWNDWKTGYLEAKGLDEDWKIKTIDSEDLEFKEVKKEIIDDVVEEAIDKKFPVLSRFNLTVNTLLPKDIQVKVREELKITVDPIHEFHFWIDLQSKEKAFRKNVSFVGSTIIEGVVDGGKETRHFDFVLNPIKKKSNNVVFTKRDINNMRTRIINPSKLEILDFSKHVEEVEIEIARPKYIWQGVPDSEKWEITRTSATLSIKETTTDEEYQKFIISPEKQVASSFCTSHIGLISISCKNETKKLSCWYSPDSEIPQISKPKKKKREEINGRQVREIYFEEIKFDKLEDNVAKIRLGDFKKKEKQPLPASTAISSTNDSGNHPYIVDVFTNTKEVIINEQNQLTIRFPFPYKIIGLYKDLHWAFVIDRYQNRLEVKNCKVCKDHQEITILPKNIPPVKGVYFAGTIKAECENKSLEVNVKVNIPSHTEKIESTAIVNADSFGGNKSFAKEWNHGDTFVIPVDNSFYIKKPGSDEIWQLEMLPCKLPLSVSGINESNPWNLICSQIRKICLFQGLSSCQPETLRILKLIASTVSDKLWIVSKLNFVNEFKSPLVYESKGVSQKIEKIIKTLYLAVDLTHYRTKKKIFFEDDKEISTNLEDEFSVKLFHKIIDIPRIGVNTRKWTMVGCSKEIDFIGFESEHGYIQFKFKGKEKGKGQVDFKCGDQTVKISVIVS